MADFGLKPVRTSAPNVAVLVLVALLPIHYGVPIAPSIFSWGFILAIPFMPVLVRGMMRERAVALLSGFGMLALLSGAMLTLITRSDHSVNYSYFWVTMGTLACALYVLLPCIRRSGEFEQPRRIAIAYAIGMVVEVLATPDSWDGNVWKFGLSFPVAVAFLAITSRSRSMVPTVIALAFIAICAIVAGDRSYFGFVAVVFVVMLLPRARSRPSRTKSFFSVAGLITAGIGIYFAGVSLALAGYLGTRNQLVTAAQLSASGSVLTSGRSESGAAIQLFLHRPIGFGPGVLPSALDVAIGQEGLAGRGLDLTGQYVREYLFGTGFKLHSITSDLWVNFGIAGLALAMLMAFIAVRALVGSVIGLRPNPLLAFAGVIALWNLAFSPIGSNLFDTVFCVALVTLIRSTSQATNVSSHDAELLDAKPPQPLGAR